jgi:hypothetical protein
VPGARMCWLRSVRPVSAVIMPLPLASRMYAELGLVGRAFSHFPQVGVVPHPSNGERPAREEIRMWQWLAWACAASVFVGIVVFALVLSTGSWFLTSFTVLIYALDLAGLRYANTKGW